MASLFEGGKALEVHVLKESLDTGALKGFFKA